MFTLENKIQKQHKNIYSESFSPDTKNEYQPKCSRMIDTYICIPFKATRTYTCTARTSNNYFRFLQNVGWHKQWGRRRRRDKTTKRPGEKTPASRHLNRKCRLYRGYRTCGRTWSHPPHWDRSGSRSRSSGHSHVLSSCHHKGWGGELLKQNFRFCKLNNNKKLRLFGY